jgi:AmmeMemoRadiSam system protein B/AmmeMemoRadiSam system protein A
VTHASPYSGSWYPGEPAELKALLGELWDKSEERTGPCLLAGGCAFITPHAGLVYSGAVAAAVYRHVERERPQRVLLAGFSHRGSPPGIWIPKVDAYETPLGRVAVDRELVGALTAAEPFRKTAESKVCDHSIEIQLPLLQKAAPEARVVPLYVSHLEPEERQAAARKLAGCLTPGTVLIASSDLTHFGKAFHYEPFPVDSRVADKLRKLDYEVLEAAGSLREELFLETLRETGATVCGAGPIALLLATVRYLDRAGEIFQEVLDYQTSGEMTGDFHHSVSYGAAGFFPQAAFELNTQEQQAVLELARRTLAAYQKTGQGIVPSLPPTGLAGLARRAALFVTLHKNGELRGCLGRSAAFESIESVVPEMTMAAALEDSRFDPVSPSETGLEIEVSILSPMKRIAGRGDFRVNEHGALLKAGGRQGLLLPQVATERGWSAERFFRALAEKAGAGPGVYSDPATRIYVFRAQVIH